MSAPVIAIFDVGKTNKKLLLFDEAYTIVFERSEQFDEITDEDGDPCENLERLIDFLFRSLDEVLKEKKFDLIAINFATYGASFVLVGEQGKAIAPLYNYLKPYPSSLQKNFYQTYGGETRVAYETASPVLGSLNSGMLLYRIRHEKPDLFQRLKHALHLPQFMSFLLTGKACSDITSIGCHTNLWNFAANDYHRWVEKEGIDAVLPVIVPSDSVIPAVLHSKTYRVGVGLHDSSAALIPYLLNFTAPFVLISTGTWCISLNPFNTDPLTAEELHQDCLCYLQYNGKSVKASRLFAGHDHEEQVQRIANHFNCNPESCLAIAFDPDIVAQLKYHHKFSNDSSVSTSVDPLQFKNRDLSDFDTPEIAYHQLMIDLVRLQHTSTRLVINEKVNQLFVDGGFSKNSLYMNLLTYFFPEMEVYAATVAQATALGAALAIHQSWNNKPLPKNLIQLTRYGAVTIPEIG
jgi:sugar (pentulose or hexulose) kinase